MGETITHAMSSLADKSPAGSRDVFRSKLPRVRAYRVALLVTAFLIALLTLTLRYNPLAVADDLKFLGQAHKVEAVLRIVPPGQL